MVVNSAISSSCPLRISSIVHLTIHTIFEKMEFQDSVTYWKLFILGLYLQSCTVTSKGIKLSRNQQKNTRNKFMCFGSFWGERCHRGSYLIGSDDGDFREILLSFRFSFSSIAGVGRSIAFLIIEDMENALEVNKIFTLFYTSIYLDYVYKSLLPYAYRVTYHIWYKMYIYVPWCWEQWMRSLWTEK